VRFQYLRDPLFLGCVAFYLTCRLLLRPLLPHGFLDAYGNDLICIPFWVPIMLWGMRKLGLRDHDLPPETHEIIVPLVVWSLIFEMWLPRTAAFGRLAVPDHLDVLCYALGALAASVFWPYHYRVRGIGIRPAVARASGHGLGNPSYGRSEATRIIEQP
jgi:hypothetical protein